jgi:hypothetical protein
LVTTDEEIWSLKMDKFCFHVLTLLVAFVDNWIVEMETNHWMSFLSWTYVDQACQSPSGAHKNIGIIQISLCN